MHETFTSNRIPPLDLFSRSYSVQTAFVVRLAETKACGVNLVSALLFVLYIRRCAVKPSRLGSCILHAAGIYMQYWPAWVFCLLPGYEDLCSASLMGYRMAVEAEEYVCSICS